MNDLIQINKTIINGAEVNSVNSREIYEYLGIATKYSMWIQRAIDKYGFIHGEDYVSTLTDPKSGKRDFIVTLDMAKELCMVTDTPKGKQVRKYFIEIEKKYTQQFQIPQTYSEALMLAAKQAEKLEQQEKKLLEQKPKVEFFEAVTNSKTAIDMAKVAKVLDKNIGRNKLFEFLRNKKILQSNNLPYQAYIDRGYFRVVEVKYTKPDGSTNISLKTLVYQKGVNYINKLLEGGK